MPSDLTFATSLANGSYASGTVVVYGNISITETAGREGSDTATSGTASRTFLVRGSSDPTVCRAALEDGAMSIDTYDGLARESIERTRHGPESWEFTVYYSALVPEVGGYIVNIDTTGGQVLRTHAIAQTKYAATSVDAPDFTSAIDVQDGQPQGVEVITPALRINVRAKIASEYVTSPIAYAKLVARMTGQVSSTSMFGGEFAAGELLFTGASGEIVGENPQLTFTFLASENVTGVTIGDVTGIAKKGHEYLWFLNKQEKDSTTKLPTISQRAGYVGQVYGTSDLTVMKIGVAPT